MELSLDELRAAAGIGVAGNFAGHLEQAGEASDFVHVQAAAEAPKGIFPWYLPNATTFVGTFPLSHDTIALPPRDAPGELQLEPEVGVLLTVTYDDAGPAALTPRAIAAFNDCSIRRPGAKRISEKKNWGAASKGVARTAIALDDLDPAGPTSTFRLACLLTRDGATHAYGIDSPLPGYSYYGATLLDWVVDRLRHQQGGDPTPLEPVGALLHEAGRPQTALVGIGATRYTPYGETTFLQDGDVATVVVYDGARSTPQDVEHAVAAGDAHALPAASVLRQAVRGQD
ncbi:DUF5718 family protein [Conexibacter sp. SYSU D00693]|uniref:DUF5718 family protein n=1 Tax=Conexibacter sp. SYSU D00693 TaxID=2812560 RepID=UPI00196AE30C|nr:DUF5718 family protein [Conexibacter sp. SYSU D00693]